MIRRAVPPLIAAILTLAGCSAGPSHPGDAAPTRPAGVTAGTVASMTFPAGASGSDSAGWNNTVPITVTDGQGEARTTSGEFAGASIRDTELVGWLDADRDGTDDAVVSFVCFGSPFAQCCAGRASLMKFVGVFDFSTPAEPRGIGATIMPGISAVRGDSGGEPRRIDRVRVEDSAIITDEKLIYPDTSGATADLGYSPDATVEVTHTFADGAWSSTERVVG
ncbi:hypothetical protein H7J07_15640 [Mycobacterium koreense]|uniref:hypothetical protein n=1 Tax=Mycolicibacillus koreensis TaxID=1069220 RepID=UPI00138BC707|nr:hypothetical protein [Mycolicibacillus koreensis]MCV7249637.1 hypothetical protein [Mycolicibacillus koreensis]BBY56748.1 hypothetical protein MKOR_39990 [Mycolicibacillus koreensis]